MPRQWTARPLAVADALCLSDRDRDRVSLNRTSEPTSPFFYSFLFLPDRRGHFNSLCPYSPSTQNSTALFSVSGNGWFGATLLKIKHRLLCTFGSIQSFAFGFGGQVGLFFWISLGAYTASAPSSISFPFFHFLLLFLIVKFSDSEDTTFFPTFVLCKLLHMLSMNLYCSSMPWCLPKRYSHCFWYCRRFW